jgi:tetratricopeptide (TPR) repeat protein
VDLFDLEAGRVLNRLPICKRPASVSFDGTGSLLTNGFEGFFRWPVRADAANPSRLTIGPPQRLPFHPGHGQIAASRDGGVIAQCMWNGYDMQQFAGGWILPPRSPTPRRVDAGQSIRWCSVSPDGRWVAFDGPHLAADGPGIHVYEVATAQRVWQSLGNGYAHPHFSLDGRWLVTASDGGQLYAVGTWEPGPQLGPGIPWAMTSHLAVLGQTNGIYRLVELATGRELARLEDPEWNAGTAAFTPDGTKLVVTARKGLCVWDLRRIRAQLAKLDLDWDAPPYPPAAEMKRQTPLEVRVNLGSLAPSDEPGLAIVKSTLTLAAMPLNYQAYLRRGHAYYQLSKWREAADDLGQALALDPGNKDAQVWFELGYASVESGQRKQAFAAYSRCLELDPKQDGAWNNRGNLQERFGEPHKAVADFSRAIERNARNAIALTNRSRLLARLGRWEQTVDDCTRLLDLVPRERQIDAYSRRALAYGRLGRYREARADYQKLVQLAPTSSLVHNNLSWLLANCPDATLRDPGQALQFAQRALELEAQVSNTWNTLGIAHYRAGNWKDAIDALENSRQYRKGGDAFDFYFLAMAHWQSGHKDEARQWYKQAVQWGEKNRATLAQNPPWPEELRRFRAEAEQLLGIEMK